MARGRPAGLHLSFDEAYTVACNLRDYWWRRGDDDKLTVWCGDRHIAIVNTAKAARVAIVRDLEAWLRGREDCCE